MSFTLTIDDGTFLVQLARDTVTNYLKTGKRIKVPENTPKKLFERCGVFVTINQLENGDKQLRGCIGFPYPTKPLVEALIESAIEAATQDPRFYPLSVHELESVVFEVSVLTPPKEVNVQKPVEYLDKIKVGEDGLIVEKGAYKGLLLPQVPVEWGWDEEEFLCQCCIKAGLPPDSWLTPGTKVYTFQALVFEEETPKGKIRQLQLSKN
ncbi:MAG: TIGR00296 family protein [Candidatus Bathyarchaeia archaeon]